MRFSAIHKVASYLMVASAFASLALSRELPPLIVALTLVFGLASFFFEPQRHAFLRSRGWTLVWNAVTVVTFAWTLLDALRGEALFAGVRFLCFLLVNKLWNRRASRDYLQAYVISFLMLVAGAALSSELAYAACFLGYVVFATWTLTLFHLRREMEENYLLKHSDGLSSERVEVERILNSRRIVGGAFLAGTSLVSIGIFLLASVTFFLIPRFGFGFFSTRARRGQATVGFSDRVELGEYGLVKDNPQVVMRIELPGGEPKAPLRMRGVSFDRYAHGHWSRTAKVPSEPLHRWDDLWLVDPPARPSGAMVRQILSTSLVQNVYLDPLDTAVLFGAGRPLAFQLPRSNFATTGPQVDLEARAPGEVIALERRVEPGTGRVYSVERKSGLRYTVYSDDHTPTVPALLAAPDVSAAGAVEMAPYLALPDDLPKRISELAQKITAGHKGPFAKAVAVESWLQKSYRYTLDLKRDERYEPLDDFLFVQKAGHCEYFASAMAILLRTQGIPTRSVNGFLGGEWNAYGNYVAMRQGDAHSWVEVWLDGIGWTTFDPTPTGERPQSWGRVRQLLDTLELAWFKWVIEYDLSKQADAFNQVRKWAVDGGSSRSWLDGIRRHGRALIAAVAALLAGAWLWRRRRGLTSDGRRAVRAHAASAAFDRAVRALSRRGHTRGEGETGRELAVRVDAAHDPGAQSFSELVELYYAARFGGVEVPAGTLERLSREVVRPAPRRDIDPRPGSH
jgi:transglutaminase-like putative cysteine protease